MYDRQLDFVQLDPVVKDIPPQEIYCFFDNDYNRWLFELIDNTSYDLDTLDDGCEVYETLYGPEYNPLMVMAQLWGVYPDAHVDWYKNVDDWVNDEGNKKL